MDFLKAEIERKRRQIQDSNLLKDPKKKYFKRADLSAQQTEEYWKKNKNVGRPELSTQISDGDASTSTSSGKTDRIQPLPRKEVIRKLRERDEPIRLFGEDDFDSYQRLKKLETSQTTVKGEGFANEFQAAMAKVDQDYLEEIIKSSGGGSEAELSTEVKVKDDGTTEEDLKEMRAELGQGSTDRDHEIILLWFKYCMKKWGDTLNERGAEEKRTIKGKMASATHAQTVTYLKPLFRKLKQKDIEEGLLESIVEIVQYMMDRNYLRANDTYLEMAIGNAPWPIGVTMVGIHARTGREKISSRYVAHVLNDETQRKYIQAMKRLMTQCQIMFPTDPSRSYNFLRPSKS